MAEKKKILILLKKYQGGVGSYTKSVQKELSKLEHVVKVISREDDLKLFSAFSSIGKIREVVKKENPEIVYTQDWSLAFPLLVPSRIFPNNHYCCFHGKSPSGLDSAMQKFVGALMGKNLIVVSERLGKLFKNATVITEGVDTSAFRPLNKKQKGIGFANYTNKIYNFDFIKQACNELGEELIIAKNLSPKEMNEFYNKIETFISLPPTYTGFGLVWLEAMAAGVPKIIGSNSGIGEKLPITKVKGFSPEDENKYCKTEKIDFIKEAIKSSKKQNYPKIINKLGFTWERHTRELIKYFNKTKD